MAITTDDFNKVWASTSPLTPYSFSDSQYKEGWNFIGSTPPARQMWDFLQKNNDEKMQYLLNNFDNYLPLSGGTVTGGLTVEGTITGNLAGNATNATNATNDANGSPIAGTYLPLAGGTMTGSIQYVNNGKVFTIGNTVTGNVDLGWNWDNREGAGLGLRSADYSSPGGSHPGEFMLFARDANNDCSLNGKPDGSLTWDNKDVERVNAKGTNYIRFESGLQICWGVSPDFNATGEKTVTFPAAFTSYRLAVGREWAMNWNENYYVKDKTNTSFKIVVIGTASTNNHGYNYVAVGWWK